VLLFSAMPTDSPMLSDEEDQSALGPGLNGHGQAVVTFSHGTSNGQEDSMSDDDDMPLVHVRTIRYIYKYLH